MISLRPPNVHLVSLLHASDCGAVFRVTVPGHQGTFILKWIALPRRFVELDVYEGFERLHTPGVPRMYASARGAYLLEDIFRTDTTVDTVALGKQIRAAAGRSNFLVKWGRFECGNIENAFHQSTLLLLEDVQGMTVDEYLASDMGRVTSRVKTDRARALVPAVQRDLTPAFAALKSMGFVHGDLFNRNVMRRTSGEFVVIDFGEAERGDDADRELAAYLQKLRAT